MKRQATSKTYEPMVASSPRAPQSTSDHAAPTNDTGSEAPSSGYLDDLMNPMGYGLTETDPTPAHPEDAPLVGAEPQWTKWEAEDAERESRKKNESAAALAKAKERELERVVAFKTQLIIKAMSPSHLFNANVDIVQSQLNGCDPVVVRRIRAAYLAQVQRSLEDDIRTASEGTDGYTKTMSHLLPGMNLADELMHYEGGASLSKRLKVATPEELETLGTDKQKRVLLERLKETLTGDEYLQARIALIPSERNEAVLERVKSTNGWFDDDEDGAMRAVMALPVRERADFVKKHPDEFEHLSDSERDNLIRMGESEASALKIRMNEATCGAGTEDDEMTVILSETKEMAAEQKRLEAKRQKTGLTERESTRLKELGDVSGLLTPKRKPNGDLEKGTFLYDVNEDLTDAEFVAKMKSVGVDEGEVAVQRIHNAAGIFNDDENELREAFADLPVSKRAEVASRAEVQHAMNDILWGKNERDEIQAFIDNDTLWMAKYRLRAANGIVSDDEALMVKAVLELPAAQRAEFEKDPDFVEARDELYADERVVMDQALEGNVNVVDTVNAATNGFGTNEALINLAADHQSPEQRNAMRADYVAYKSGLSPKGDFASVYDDLEGTWTNFGDTDHDATQTFVDRIVNHGTPRRDPLTGLPLNEDSALLEANTPEGRLTAARLAKERSDEKMGGDLDGGGWLADAFIDDNESAVQSHQRLHSSYESSMKDHQVSPEEHQQLTTDDNNFRADYTSMVVAQEAATNVMVQVVGAIIGAVSTVVSAGAAGPAWAAYIASSQGSAVVAAVGTALSMTTKQLMGGARFDVTGEEGLHQIAMTCLDVALSRVGGAKALEDAAEAGGSATQIVAATGWTRAKSAAATVGADGIGVVKGAAKKTVLGDGCLDTGGQACMSSFDTNLRKGAAGMPIRMATKLLGAGTEAAVEARTRQPDKVSSSPIATTPATPTTSATRATPASNRPGSSQKQTTPIEKRVAVRRARNKVAKGSRRKNRNKKK